MLATSQIEIKALIYQECFSDHIRLYINQFLPWKDVNNVLGG